MGSCRLEERATQAHVRGADANGIIGRHRQDSADDLDGFGVRRLTAGVDQQRLRVLRLEPLHHGNSPDQSSTVPIAAATTRLDGPEGVAGEQE